MASRARAAVRWAARAGLWLLICLALLEGLLQLGSLFVGDRATGFAPGARQRVLAIGDSHTYGAFVDPADAYPAQLQAQLDARDPGYHSVLNRGVPGMNTAQLVAHLPVWLSRDRPDVVIVWAGVNNSWNITDVGAEPGRWWLRLAGLASHSRLYRLVRVWLHDRRLQRAQEGQDGMIISKQGALGATERWLVREGDRAAEIVHQRATDPIPPDEMETRAERDYARIVELARAAGAEPIFIAYPYDLDVFRPANRAVRRVARRYGVPLVEAGHSIQRLRPEERRFTWAMHPTAPIYREVARDLLAYVAGPNGPGR